MRVRRVAIAVTAGGVLALAAATAATVARHGGDARGGRGAGVITLQVAAGIAIYAAGSFVAIVRAARLPGLLLAAVGPVLYLGALPLPEAGGAVLFTAALASGPSAATLAAAGTLLYLRSTRTTLNRIAAAAALAVTAVWLGLVPTIVYDPDAAGCFTCPQNLILARGSLHLHDALVRSGLYAGVVACAALSILILVGWSSLERAVAIVVAPVMLGGAASAAVSAVAFGHATRTGFPFLDATTRELWIGQCVFAAVIAAGIALEFVRTRVLSHRIASMVVDAFPTASALRAALAQSAGDPDLYVVFPHGGSSVVDADGRVLDEAGYDGAVTNIVRNGETVAQLRHAKPHSHAPERLAEAARVAGLVLEYASSKARLRAHLAELKASRARIVVAGDTERRRLERDLHDGAQQRLIALSVGLQRPRHDGRTLTRAREEVQTALDELRLLAHGIHPAALTDAGLVASLRELAEGSRVPIRFEDLAADPVPPEIAIGLYRVVLDSVRCAERAGDGGPVSVNVEISAGSFRTHLTLPGVDAETGRHRLQHAFDRVAALGGEAHLRTVADGTAVDVWIPCES